MTHELPLPLKMSLPKFIIAEEGGREAETLQQFEIRTSNFPPEQSSSEDRTGRQKSRFYHHFVCLNGPRCSAANRTRPFHYGFRICLQKLCLSLKRPISCQHDDIERTGDKHNFCPWLKGRGMTMQWERERAFPITPKWSPPLSPDNILRERERRALQRNPWEWERWGRHWELAELDGDTEIFEAVLIVSRWRR